MKSLKTQCPFILILNLMEINYKTHNVYSHDEQLVTHKLYYNNYINYKIDFYCYDELNLTYVNSIIWKTPNELILS